MIPSRPDSSDSHGCRDLTNLCIALTPEEIQELFVGTAVACARFQMLLRRHLAFAVQLLSVAAPRKAVPRRRVAHVVGCRGGTLCSMLFRKSLWASTRPSLCLSMRVKTIFCSALDRNKLASQTLSPDSLVVIDYFQIFK